MPTPAKLVAGVLLAALAWLVCDLLVREVLPEGSRVGRFREIVAAGAFLVGWRVIGPAATGRMGRGGRLVETVTAGIGAGVVLIVLTLVLHAFYRMIALSLTGRYPELGRAVDAWLGFVWEDVGIVTEPVVLGPALLGSAVVGAVAGVVGRVWR